MSNSAALQQRPVAAEYWMMIPSPAGHGRDNFIGTISGVVAPLMKAKQTPAWSLLFDCTGITDTERASGGVFPAGIWMAVFERSMRPEAAAWQQLKRVVFYHAQHKTLTERLIVQVLMKARMPQLEHVVLFETPEILLPAIIRLGPSTNGIKHLSAINSSFRRLLPQAAYALEHVDELDLVGVPPAGMVDFLRMVDMPKLQHLRLAIDCHHWNTSPKERVLSFTIAADPYRAWQNFERLKVLSIGGFVWNRDLCRLLAHTPLLEKLELLAPAAGLFSCDNFITEWGKFKDNTFLAPKMHTLEMAFCSFSVEFLLDALEARIPKCRELGLPGLTTLLLDPITIASHSTEQRRELDIWVKVEQRQVLNKNWLTGAWRNCLRSQPAQMNGVSPDLL